MSLLYIIHVVPFDKWTRATGTWTSPVKETSSGESRHVECGNNDWKRKGVADLMERRKVGVLCVQETRWKGNTAK